MRLQGRLEIISPIAEAAEGLSSDDVGGDSEVSPIALTEAPGTPPPPPDDTHTHTTRLCHCTATLGTLG